MCRPLEHHPCSLGRPAPQFQIYIRGTACVTASNTFLGNSGYGQHYQVDIVVDSKTLNLRFDERDDQVSLQQFLRKAWLASCRGRQHRRGDKCGDINCFEMPVTLVDLKSQIQGL